MSFELRYPNITAQDEKGQLVQVKSYLHQLVEQIQWALNNVGTSESVSAAVAAVKSQTAPSKSKEDAAATFDSIKALIIKSAEIVNSIYDQISTRLEGIYVAESDFGAYAERTSQDILQTSTDIESLYTNIQTILTDIDNIEYTLVEANAHIKSGILYYDEDGIPIYGLEIGQRNVVDGVEVFNKYARFIADRLSFYDHNDTEVAYISDRKLYIENVEVLSSIKIGGFVDIVQSNGDVVTKWVGRG